MASYFFKPALTAVALAASLTGVAHAAAPLSLGGMGIAAQWTDFENQSGEMPLAIWGNADTVLADRIGLHVQFANGLEGSVTYSGVAGHWNSAWWPGTASETSTGFFTAAQGLHFLYNNNSTLPMAWENFSMSYSNNFDLDYQSGTSNFRASVPGWSSAVFTTYTSAVAAVPEPETYAMLLVGLGLIGGVARRKKSA